MTSFNETHHEPSQGISDVRRESGAEADSKSIGCESERLTGSSGESSASDDIPLCTCGSPYLMTHVIWCQQWDYWYF